MSHSVRADPRQWIDMRRAAERVKMLEPVRVTDIGFWCS